MTNTLFHIDGSSGRDVKELSQYGDEVEVPFRQGHRLGRRWQGVRLINDGKPNPTRITVEGRSGVNVQPFSAARGKAEILFRGGTRFDVLENFSGPDGVRVLKLREAP